MSSSCPGGSSGGLMLQHPRGARQAPQLRGHADFRAIVTERLLPMLRSFNPNVRTETITQPHPPSFPFTSLTNCPLWCS